MAKKSEVSIQNTEGITSLLSKSPGGTLMIIGGALNLIPITTGGGPFGLIFIALGYASINSKSKIAKAIYALISIFFGISFIYTFIWGIETGQGVLGSPPGAPSIFTYSILVSSILVVIGGILVIIGY